MKFGKFIKSVVSNRKVPRILGFPAEKVTVNEATYLKDGNNRLLEKNWQDYMYSRPIFTLQSYAEAYPVSAIEEIIPCMMCGSQSFRHVMTPSKKDWKYEVVMCTQCDLLFRNPNVQPQHLHLLYDQVDYNKFLTGGYGGKKRQEKYEGVLNSFADLIPEKGPLKVLDFGCGNGLFLNLAKRRGYQGWGVDLSPHSIAHAKKMLGHDRLWCGDLQDIKELESERFDLITLWSVLAHLPRPIDTFSMIRKYLKPGGALLVFTVNANSLLLKRDLANWNGFTRNHLAFFSPSTARILFRKAGFKQVYARPHYANTLAPLRKKLTDAQWQTYKDNVLENAGGNMNRFLAFN